MRVSKFLLIGAVSLSGCAMGVSNVCPRIEPYSQAAQTRAAAELEALPEGSVVADMIGDYGVMRAELRGAGC